MLTHKGTMISSWVEYLNGYSQDFRRLPDSQLQEMVEKVFDCNFDFILNDNLAQLDKLVEATVCKGKSYGLSLSEMQYTFAVYRFVTYPLLIASSDSDDLLTSILAIDMPVVHAILKVSEVVQALHHREMMARHRELSRMLEELKAEQRKSTATNRLKDQFLANISHELRTPLTSIIGFSKMLKDITPIEGSDDGSKLRIIHEQGEALLHMINRLIMIAEINAGTALFVEDVISMKELAELTVTEIKELTMAKNHKITLSVSDDMPLMLGDSDKLHAVIYELIYNAVKFSPGNSSVKFECGLKNGVLEIAVTDNGIGINDEKINSIFDTFYQLDGSSVRQFGGSGLGLTMIKKIIALFNGVITVESVLGKGTSFYVKMPFNSALEN